MNTEPINDVVALLSVAACEWGLAKSPMDAASILAGPVSSTYSDFEMPLDELVTRVPNREPLRVMGNCSTYRIIAACRGHDMPPLAVELRREAVRRNGAGVSQT